METLLEFAPDHACQARARANGRGIETAQKPAKRVLCAVLSSLLKHFYQFREFTLDTDQKVLLRQGKPVALTQKVFDTLLILVENSGRIVTKDELMHRLWPETFVEEANLAFNIQ